MGVRGNNQAFPVWGCRDGGGVIGGVENSVCQALLENIPYQVVGHLTAAAMTDDDMSPFTDWEGAVGTFHDGHLWLYHSLIL